jgi:hypothetical protein
MIRMTAGHDQPDHRSYRPNRTYNDLEVAGLVHRATAEVQDAGRFGDRKVFIASLWARRIPIEAQTGGT